MKLGIIGLGFRMSDMLKACRAADPGLEIVGVATTQCWRRILSRWCAAERLCVPSGPAVSANRVFVPVRQVGA